MKRLVWLLIATACSKQSTATEPPPRSPALNALMNDQVNPAFSRLSFLVFHADTSEDPAAARSELAREAQRLASATSQLSTWPDPPVQSQEGRDVFHTYSAALNTDAQQLVQSVAAADRAGSIRVLERIAETCNNCHHFFRLKIEDSVVKPQ